MNDDHDSHKRPTVGFGSEPPKIFSPEDLPPEKTYREEACGEETCGEETRGQGDDTSSSINAPELLIGQTISGKYKLLEQISDGGLSKVFRARHVLSGREFVFKLLNPPADEHTSQAEQLERFHTVVENLRAVTHPNVVSIEDFGVFEFHGYIASEFYQGRTLQQALLQNEDFPLARIASIISTICDALHSFHTAGIVHKDLNTANIFLVQQPDGQETPLLLNCGITDLLSKSDDSAVSEAGMVLGDPKYLSPEQVQGGAINAATDIYSLGIITYELLVGTPPFTDEDVMELLIKHAKSKPRPLSQVSVDRDIPTSIEKVVLKALSKSPADRQQTSSQFSYELVSAIEQIPDRPTQTLPEWPKFNPELFLDEEEVESQTELDYGGDFPRPRRTRKIFIILLLLFLASVTAVLWQGAEYMGDDTSQVIAKPQTDIDSPQQAQLEPDSVQTEAEVDNLEEAVDSPIADSFAVDHRDSLENTQTVVPESSVPESSPGDSEIAELSVDDALSKISSLKRGLEDEEISSPPPPPPPSIPTPEPITTPPPPPPPIPTTQSGETEFLTPGWYVQVTAKEDKVEAEEVSARLIKAGFTVAYQAANVEGVFYHRVLIGPLNNLEEAKHTKNRIVSEKLHDEVPFIKKSQ